MPTTIIIPTPPATAALPSRELLTADRIYYVASTSSSPAGSDSAVGSAAAPFATIQKALDVVATLDLGPNQVTVQLADGTHQVLPHYTDGAYDGLGLIFTDPVGGLGAAPYAEDLFSSVRPCTLRGNPTTPSAVVIQDTAAFVAEFAGNYGNYQLLFFEFTHKWGLTGVKLLSPNPGTTAYYNAWAFRSSVDFVSVDFCASFMTIDFLYAYTSFIRLKNLKISATAGASLEAAWRCDQGSILFSEGTFDCQNSVIGAGGFSETVGTSYTYATETYSNKASITTSGYKWVISFESCLSSINPGNFPGATTGFIGPGCQLLHYGAGGVVDGEHVTVINPTGSRMGVVGGGEDVGSLEGNGFTFSNEGAATMAIFLLPGVDPTFTGVVGNHSHVYSFVVQAAAGIRVQAPAGHTLRVGNMVSATAGKLESTTIGSTLTIRCINLNQWLATDCMGTWSIT